MKLKIQKKTFQDGSYYYAIYKRVWFLWDFISLFDTLEEAEKYALRILENTREGRTPKKEKPVYYRLEGNKITYKTCDGIERTLMEEPPLKLKKDGELE
jgi:hypothetical protein